MSITAEQYQQFVDDGWFGRMPRRADDSDLRNLFIMGMGIGGEAGEVQELLKKSVRDGKLDLNDLKLELGDVLYYLSRIASWHGMTLTEVMEANVVKLEERQAKGRTGAGKRPALATPGEPRGTYLAHITANQAQNLLEYFSGEPTTYVLIRCKEGDIAPDDDGEKMPGGLYVYDLNCPEEGVIYLGDEDEEFRPVDQTQLKLEALDQALQHAVGSILSQYACDKIKAHAAELLALESEKANA